ncbi:hypothetical protein BGY98DRAFT_479282 [Russula aff. rugulosa BPL654]|nr:hypothetical protein BGY98DRAFT_479282 [Russula aff. rugulosa BPL654]
MVLTLQLRPRRVLRCYFKLALRPSWRISPWKFRASFRVPFFCCVFSRAESCSTTSSRTSLQCYNLTVISSRQPSSLPFSLLLGIDVEPLSMFPLSSLMYYFGFKSSHADDMSHSSLSSICAILHSDSYRFRTEKPVLCYKYKCPLIKDRKRQTSCNPSFPTPSHHLITPVGRDQPAQQS